jgi:hypothetical protein
LVEAEEPACRRTALEQEGFFRSPPIRAIRWRDPLSTR